MQRTGLILALVWGLLCISPHSVSAPPLGTGLGDPNSNGNPSLPSLPTLPTLQSLKPVGVSENGTRFYTPLIPVKKNEPSDSVPQRPLLDDPSANPTLSVTPSTNNLTNLTPDDPIIAITPTPIEECPPEAPIRLDPTICVNSTMMDEIVNGAHVVIDEDAGVSTYYYDEPDDFSYFDGGYAFDAEKDHCNPNVQVLLQESALAGSQVTRAMVGTQLSYPEVDPIVAVNNPKPDGYGGSCSLPLMTFDLVNMLDGHINNLLQSLQDITNIINAIANFDIDSLFSAACTIVGNILGDVQDQLISDIDDTLSDLVSDIIAEIRPGFIAPLQSLLNTATSYNLLPDTVTLDGVATGGRIIEMIVPDVGYVYMTILADGTSMVLRISDTPLG